MRTNWILGLTCLFCLLACTKLDNYTAPTGTIYGKVIDAVTQQPLLTEIPNGFRIRYIEQDYINPNVSVQNFYGKADGSFERGYIFAASYKVFPIEGAFFPVKDSTLVVVTDNQKTEVIFTVVPYLNIDASVKVDGKNIVVDYKISRPQVGDKIFQRRALCSKVPTVNNTVFYKDVTTNLSGINDNTILNTNYSDTIKGLAAGTYYVRAAARTSNANSKFNYSAVVEVVVP